MKNYFFLFAALAGLSLITSCKDDDTDDTDSENTNQEQTDTSNVNANLVIPTYADDYRTDITNTWAGRSSWNLANVHDPSVAYFNGYYYMYQTDASYGNVHSGSGGHFIGRRSKDLVKWEVLDKPAMTTVPSWVTEKLKAYRSQMGLPSISNPSLGFWAPVIRKAKRNGVDVLRMYYSMPVDNYIKTGAASTTAFDGSWTERAFIGMRETTDPVAGEWTDYGMVVCSSSDKGSAGYTRSSTSDWNAYFYFNAIDPTYITTPDSRDFLIYGSWHSGFAIVEINPQTGMPLSDIGDPWANSVTGLTANGYGTRIGSRSFSSRWQGSEGPEIIYKDGYYYLFMAYDGLDIPYNTRVVRSKNVDNSYVDMCGTDYSTIGGDCYPIVTHPYKFKRGNGWVGISHVAVFNKEGTNDWFLSCQGRLPSSVDQYSNAVMMGQVRKLIWCPSSKANLTDLWPVASPERYAGEAQTAVAESELYGYWENINLKYNYGNQCAADEAYVILKKDHTCTGGLGTTWSYDATTQFLTIGDIVVKVERGVDWEAGTRALTLVYAGCDNNTKITYWGKRIKATAK